MLKGLHWRGRLDEAEVPLEELRELGLPAPRWRSRHAELLLARGDAHAAAPWYARPRQTLRPRARSRRTPMS